MCRASEGGGGRYVYACVEPVRGGRYVYACVEPVRGGRYVYACVEPVRGGRYVYACVELVRGWEVCICMCRASEGVGGMYMHV